MIYFVHWTAGVHSASNQPAARHSCNYFVYTQKTRRARTAVKQSPARDMPAHTHTGTHKASHYRKMCTVHTAVLAEGNERGVVACGRRQQDCKCVCVCVELAKLYSTQNPPDPNRIRVPSEAHRARNERGGVVVGVSALSRRVGWLVCVCVWREERPNHTAMDGGKEEAQSRTAAERGMCIGVVAHTLAVTVHILVRRCVWRRRRNVQAQNFSQPLARSV